MRSLRTAVLAAVALVSGACVIDPYEDPLPGKDAVLVLKEGASLARTPWPVAYRRGARFVVENRTGKPIETLILDLSRCKRPPRELVGVDVEEPAGAPWNIMFAPHGTYQLKAQVGTPGTTLLQDGEHLVVVLRVLGEAGGAELEARIPGAGGGEKP